MQIPGNTGGSHRDLVGFPVGIPYSTTAQVAKSLNIVFNIIEVKQKSPTINDLRGIIGGIQGFN